MSWSSRRFSPEARAQPDWWITDMATYVADVPAARPFSDYASRIAPSHCGASTPLEDPHIVWYR